MIYKYKTDKIDMKILQELSVDCTKPINQIAKKARVSRETATYRITQLEKQGTITKYQTLIDISKTGVLYGRIGLRLANNTNEQHKNAIDILKKQKNAIWIASTRGRYDIIITYIYKEISELAKFIDYIKKNIGHNIDKLDVSNLQKLYTCANNFITKKDEPLIEPAIIDYTKPLSMLDETNNKIIEILRNKSRISILKIALKLNHSTKTIINRISKLEKDKVILRYQIAINPRIFGLELYHVFWSFQRFDEVEIQKLKNYLLNLRETAYITESIGLADLECDILASNERELYDKLNIIKEKFPNIIKNFDIMLILDVHTEF